MNEREPESDSLPSGEGGQPWFTPIPGRTWDPFGMMGEIPESIRNGVFLRYHRNGEVRERITFDYRKIPLSPPIESPRLSGGGALTEE